MRHVKTDGQTTFHVTPHIEIQVRQTDKLRFLSSLILESKIDRQTDKLRFIWLLRQTYGQSTLHFIPHIRIHARKTDGQSTFYFSLNVVVLDRQTNYFSLYRHIMIQDRQSDKLSYISSFILVSTDFISFHPSYWDPRKSDRRTHYTSFHPPIWIYARQTKYVSFQASKRKLRKTSRRTKYETFHPSYWNLRTTDGQTTFHFIPNIEHFILGCKYDRRTDKPSCSSYCPVSFTNRRPRGDPVGLSRECVVHILMRVVKGD